jgi:hypothetical protein
LTDDLVKRLNMVDATMNPMTLVIVAREAANRIEQLKLDIVGLKIKNTQLEAALDDVATYLPRAEWHYLKDETLITIGEKKDEEDGTHA